MKLIRYVGYNSESGAYIFAPSDIGHVMKLKVLDVYLIKSSIYSYFVVFYKLTHKYSCFGVFTVSLDHIGDY